jgi:hypothetical protein
VPALIFRRIPMAPKDVVSDAGMPVDLPFLPCILQDTTQENIRVKDGVSAFFINFHICLKD